MDTELFVKNVDALCTAKGVSMSKAGSESGAGQVVDNIKRGSIPSVERVQRLASYLGVTVSDLLGETKADVPKDIGLSDAEQLLIEQFRRLTKEQQDLVIRMVQAASDNQQ